LSCFFIVIAAFLFLPYFSQVELPVVQMSAFGSETVRAELDEIIEDGQIDLGDTVQRTKSLLIWKNMNPA